ncbi:ABC transporter permease [Alkaliphilus peptidifermentans]|uniref:Nucleoside ABC transporter membrane protein n=1 Tax=Alkaliphilus peptidifermentans DSM 18978 TaxID=1120976 RepID=A0A1G5KSS5_9FIRM|nr:ABC transporter permease [Alkaliphilus peptidifermentans]SCZ03637.1 nucleoside ABC transporter membrane protein [Alkaliphilus peptidifermentans DSM 18978]
MKDKGLKEKILHFILNGNFGFTLVSIILGLAVGAIILQITGFNAFEAYKIMIQGVFSRPNYIAWTIVRSTPIIITGLSVAFAFKTGLFNIGAEGQFIIGAITAAAVGYFVKLPAVLHIPLVILAAITAAGFWGAIAGYLKAKFGVHEVISTIMLNWIALYLNNYIVRIEGFRRPLNERSYAIQQSASIVVLEEWKRSEAGRAWLLNHEFWRDVFRTPLNLGIVFAIVLAIIVWFILNKTTLGYELKAVGYNKHAAEYGGINVSKSMLVSMSIAGALAGLAGALHVMGDSKSIASLAAMEGYGFDGIAVALIGGNTPLGVLLGGLLFGGLKYGGSKIQPTLGAPSEVISIVIGTIVFFIAMPKLIKMVMKLTTKNRGAKNVE